MCSWWDLYEELEELEELQRWQSHLLHEELEELEEHKRLQQRQAHPAEARAERPPQLAGELRRLRSRDGLAQQHLIEEPQH